MEQKPLDKNYEEVWKLQNVISSSKFSVFQMHPVFYVCDTIKKSVWHLEKWAVPWGQIMVGLPMSLAASMNPPFCKPNLHLAFAW
jgi:hypothetical protein